MRHRDGLPGQQAPARPEPASHAPQGPARAERRGRVALVEVLSESIDEENLEHIRAVLTAEAAWARALVLDLNRVRFISSRTLGLLVTVYKQMQRRGGPFVLAHVSEPLRQILATTNLDRLFTMAEDAEAAAESLREAGQIPKQAG